MNRVKIKLLRSAATLLFFTQCNVAFATNEKVAQLNRYMQSMTELLASEQRTALGKIQMRDRRDLAMTYYLRAGSTIDSRWSWTQERITAYERSTDYTQAVDEIAKISARFTAENPKYQLYVNTQVRSLEAQLQRWQKVRSIGVAARELREAALSELKNGYSTQPDSESLQKYRDFLTSWRASYPPTLAAPGMSLHGRGGAFDFQICDHRGNVIATTNSSTSRRTWHNQGWAKKLAHAIAAVSTRFVGPLAIPDEPWHYEYRSAN